MTKLFFIIITLIHFNVFYGQSFFSNFEKDGSNNGIEINIDTSWANSGIFVEKKFASLNNNHSIIKQNSLLLLGDFRSENDIILLDYLHYNYYWIPLDPTIPFYHINRGLSCDIEVGKFFIGTSDIQERRGGDISYYCTCGGHKPDSPGRGGCVASLNGNIVDCVEDGDCSDYCIGSVVEHLRTIEGGGIFIQVSKEKNQLIHNFDTR